MRSASSMSALTTPTYQIDLYSSYEVPHSSGGSDSSVSFLVNSGQRNYKNDKSSYSARSVNISATSPNQDNENWHSSGHLSFRNDRSSTPPASFGPALVSRPHYFGPKKTTSLTDALSSDPQSCGIPMFEHASFSRVSDNVRSNQGKSGSMRQTAIILHPGSEDSFTPSRQGQGASAAPFTDYVPLKVSSASANDREKSMRATQKDLPRVISPVKSGGNQHLRDFDAKSSGGNTFVPQKHTSGDSVHNAKRSLPDEHSTDVMLNAAMGVRAELEQDPKFQSRTEGLPNSRIFVKSPQNGNFYKQSPSFLQLQSNLLKPRRFPNPAQTVPTFSPKKVHELFSKQSGVPLAIVTPAVRPATAVVSSVQITRSESFSQRGND